MAFNDLERAVSLEALRRFLEAKRPPEHIRPQLDLGYSVAGHVVDLFEIRTDWQDKSRIRHTPVARIKFVRTKELWFLYWMRSDLKWHAYKADPVHQTLQSALQSVAADAYGCFFG